MVAVIVSNSRGGILFNILVIVLNLIIYIYLFRKLNVIRKILLSILFLVFIIGSFNIILMKNQDNKWKNLLNVIYLIKIDNPLDLLCNGTENFRRK
jgi:glucan phosphoethanolaminetransferase (alkaline phosphatase superfamily)